MCGGGGKGTGGYNQMGGQWGNLTPQQQATTQASPEAISWYQQAMGKAQQAAATPWQNYSTNPADFVAQLNQQQQGAQQGLAAQAAATQPFSQMGAGMQAASGMGNAAQMAGQYMNPFMQQVAAPVIQQQQQQLAQQQADAIRGGAFGGPRAGLQRAALQGQQNLGLGQIYAGGYGQALGAAQTDLQRQLAAGQGLSQAGIAAQQASLGAGTLGQQTEQAGKTALYNQFQQARMFPYQQAQFLAGIAGGLGPLLGQQSYQSQATNPFGMFLADGGAVDESRMGGAVTDGGDYARGGYARGGVDEDPLAIQEQMYRNIEKPVETSLPTGQIQAAQGLKPAEFSPMPKQESGLDKAGKLVGLAEKGISGIGKVYDWLNPSETGGMGENAEKDSGSSTLGGLAKTGAKMGLSAAANYFLPGSGFLTSFFADGGRAGYEEGGDIFDRGVLGAESGRRQFDEQGRTLRSPKGAAGIAQVMPGTAREAATLAGVPYDEQRYLNDEKYNAALGKAYFNEKMREFGGDEEKALAAYNAGAGRVRQAVRRAERLGGDYKDYLPRETQEYIPSVYRHAGADDAGVGRALTRMTPTQRSYMASAKGVAPAATEPREESGLLDTLTSEKYVVPALTGLGAALEGMVTSPTVGIGGALLRGAGAGIGAGAKQYGETAKGLEERRKLHEEATTSAAEGKLLGAETVGKLSQLPIFPGPGGMKLIRMADGSFMNFTDWLERGGNVFGNDAAVAAAEEVRNRMRGSETTGYPGGVVPFGTEPATVTEGSITTPGGVAGPRGEAPIPAEGTTVPVKDIAREVSTQPPILKPAAPVQLTGVTVGNAAQAAANQEMRAASSIGGEGAMAESAKIKERIDTAGAAARPQAIYNAQVANIISEAANAKSWDAPGAASETRANIVNGLNTLARSMGLGDTVFGEMESRDQMLKKINAMRAEATVTGANQAALGSLETVLNALPSQGQAPRAGTFNAASNWVQNQKQIDKQNYTNAYGLRSSGLYNMVDNAFDQDNAQNKYAAEEKALQDLMLHPGGPKIIDSFMHGRDLSGAPLKDKKAIDRFFEKNFKVPGMSRYFMGAAGG